MNRINSHKSIEPAAVGTPVGGVRVDIRGFPARLEPGQVLQARVEARLTDGSYKVIAAGQAMSMALPPGVSPGDVLELQFVTGVPRLTFALKYMPQAPPLPPLPDSGVFIAAAKPDRPVLYDASRITPQLAELPADSVALSRESARSENHAVELRAGSPEQQPPALDTVRFVMQLDIRPGQWLACELQERRPGPQQNPNAPKELNTCLRLELPRLGAVEAALSLGEGCARVRIAAANASTAILLEEHCASLRDALGCAVLPTASITIAHNEHI